MRNRVVMALVAVLVVAVAVWAVAAAGGDDEEQAKGAGKKNVSLRLWVMNNGPKPVPDTERIVAPFEKKTGIDVKVQLVGWDVQFDRIRNAAVSGEGPDVTQAGTTQVPFFAALGGFEDIVGRVGDVGGESAYAPGVWKTTQVVGRDGTWAVPWFTEARAIYYRKDLLKKAGVDPKTAFTDWAAFRATLEKLKSSGAVDGKDTQPFGVPGKKAFDLVHNVMPFVWEAGGAELSDDTKKSTIASSKAQEGVSYFAGSEDSTQKAYADLMGMFPARLDPQKQAGEADANHRSFYEAIQDGRTYAPIPQWGQVETAYKTRFGNILDMAAGQGKSPYSPEAVQKELKAAEKEADGLLAQSAG